MVTDLFTVQKDDIIELVAEMMDWRRIRHTPVEDAKGNLVGLVTYRTLVRHFIKGTNINGKAVLVKDIMIKDPLSIKPEATIIEAMDMMQKHRIGCLPVVKDSELIGIITEMDFLNISGRLIRRLEKKKG